MKKEVEELEKYLNELTTEKKEEISIYQDDLPPIIGNMVYPPILKPGDEVGDDAVTLAGNVVIDPDEFENEVIDIEPTNGMDGRLAGDVMIDLPGGRKTRGVVMEPGLAGYIVLPTPKKPTITKIRQPKNKEYPPLTGSVILPHDFGTVISVISSFLEKYKLIKRKPEKDAKKLAEFIVNTRGEFHWNEDYVKDENISSNDKMECAKDIAIDNLKVIREATKSYQRELDITDGKGMKN